MKPHIVSGSPVAPPSTRTSRTGRRSPQGRRARRNAFTLPSTACSSATASPSWRRTSTGRALATFSPDEIASGLDRVYRLVLQRAGSVPPALLDSVRLLPTVEYVRLGRVGAADLPPLAATAMSTTTDTASREAIGLPEAHAFCRGDRTVKVAVLDTGVAVDHPELAPAMEPGRDFVDIIDGASRFFGDYLGVDDRPRTTSATAPTSPA